MPYTILAKKQIISLTQFVALLSIALLAPIFHQQLITGTIVNAVLLITTVLLGWPVAITIGTLPSLIAAAWGTLPSPLIPMIPFIITSNVILIVIFFLLKNKNYWLAAGSGAILKFLFLFATSTTLFTFLWPQKIAASMATMMSWPQLYTALLGSVVAFLALKMLKSIR